MENRLRLFSDLFNNGAAGSCWPASPGSLAGADSHCIINCLLLAVQWDTAGLLERSLVLWEAAPSSCLRQGSFNKWLSSPENSSSYRGVHVAVVTSTAAATRQGVHPVLFIYCGTVAPPLLCLRQQLGKAKAVASSCVGETEAQLCCHTNTRIMDVQHTSSHSISSC